MSAIPVLILAQFEESSDVFTNAIKPDFKVDYVFLSPTAALQDLPFIIKGRVPPRSTSTLDPAGNADFNPPKAIIFTSPIYDEVFLDATRQILAANKAHLPILKPDWDATTAATAVAAAAATTTTTGADDTDAAAPDVEDVKQAAERAVKVLKNLDGEGKLDGKDEGIYLY
ncbi:hypothetical protein Daesc_003831 [Daldinia eschscholtzii]|uniref:Uncharacterized protein n=1 Tax=Daldinia eschscholtzii TaxID=292717 RepID=A0AAX6MML5_9PEZI